MKTMVMKIKILTFTENLQIFHLFGLIEKKLIV